MERHREGGWITLRRKNDINAERAKASHWLALSTPVLSKFAILEPDISYSLFLRKTARMNPVSQLAASYFKLLSGVDWKDPILVAGLREGLNKFLSNAHLASLPGPSKYHKTHFISDDALEVLKSGKRSGLVFEHMVPKTKYIQRPCEKEAEKGSLTIEEIESRLVKYWALATITDQEDRRLDRISMPVDWDLSDVMARYRAVGISLHPNPFYMISEQ